MCIKQNALCSWYLSLSRYPAQFFENRCQEGMNTIHFRLQLVDSSIHDVFVFCEFSLHSRKPVLHGNFDFHYFVLNTNQVVRESVIWILELNWTVCVAFKLCLKLESKNKQMNI